MAAGSSRTADGCPKGAMLILGLNLRQLQLVLHA